MISSIQPAVEDKKPLRRKVVSLSGYASMGFGAACSVTGMKSVKFPHKMKVHKYSAYLAGISALAHLVALKWKK